MQLSEMWRAVVAGCCGAPEYSNLTSGSTFWSISHGSAHYTIRTKDGSGHHAWCIAHLCKFNVSRRCPSAPDPLTDSDEDASCRRIAHYAVIANWSVRVISAHTKRPQSSSIPIINRCCDNQNWDVLSDWFGERGFILSLLPSTELCLRTY